MASPYYKGPQQTGKIANTTQAAQVPNLDGIAAEQNARKTRDIIKGIDALNGLASQAVNKADEFIKYDAVQKGKLEASQVDENGNPKESSASQYAWGGIYQQSAYNQTRAELATRDMPSKVVEYMKQDPEIKIPLDEMTDEQRAVAYTRAKDRFFEEKGIKGSSYQGLAEQSAADIQNKHLPILNQQAVALGQAKAVQTVQDTIAADARTYGGNPAALEEHINANFNKYAVALGGSEQAQEAIAKGLLGSVTNENPSLEALAYLKSPEAKKRFSAFKGFDQVVQQADIFTTKAQAAYVDKIKKQEESGFYINLSAGGFRNASDVNEYLKASTQISDEEKFNLRNKAMKYLKTSGEATSLKQAVDNRQYNIVNAQKPEVLEELFSRNVGSPDALNLRNMTADQENALVNWVQRGYNVPKWISKFGDSPLNNGDTVALDSQLKLYSNLKGRLGQSGVGTIFSSDTQAKMEQWATLRADTTITPADRKKVLDNFDNATKQDENGISLNSTIRKELDDDGGQIKDKIASFASEGGSAVFGGADDLQPLFTFSGMDRPESSPSFDYANQSITSGYAVYRRAGLSQDDALSRAQQDFQKKFQWVDFDGKNAYIPREYGADFSKKAMQYLEQNKVLEAIAVDENMSIEEVRNSISMQPARDYNSTRKVSVYLNGIEKNISFTADQFHSEEKLMNQAQIDKTVLEYQKRVNSPEYQKQLREMSTVQRIMKDLNFKSRDADLDKLLR